MRAANKFIGTAAIFAKRLILGVLTGLCGGVVGALFAWCITLVTDLRTANGWLICLLPFGGLASAGIYKLLKTTGVGTNQVIKSSAGEGELPLTLTPAIFISSVISHLFGASVGREGAAIQLGGGIAALIGRAFRISGTEKQTLVYCGMAALFSAVFGAPLAAFAFALEVVYVGHICLKAVASTLIASVTAYWTAVSLGAHPERFALVSVPNITFSVVWKVLVVAALGAVLSVLFCLSLHHCKAWFRKLLKNEFWRIAAGGLILVLLTAAVRNQDYNGAGVHVIQRIFTDGNVGPEAFLLKWLFTCIAVAAGFNGGEIIPTLFIGASFGSTAAAVFGLPPALGAATGLTALFCGVTNCPLAAILLSIELFSGQGAFYILLSAIISFLISGKASLYSAQKYEGIRTLWKHR